VLTRKTDLWFLEKNVIHEPSNSQSLEFETVEVISRDSISLSAYAKYEYLDFARRHDWKRNHKSGFAVWKNQFSLLVKCRNNTGIRVFFKQCFGGVFSDLVFANGQNNVVFVFAENVIHEPSNSQSLEFETVEVISRDSISLSAYAKYEYLDFAKPKSSLSM
jgi:hypothetical protein